ncbi:hypothetical protein lbkm_0394 [Lachnospiraceae bacterium KM106-2]|nr:hypothetical protein lbkm_0394 [Lachnospiraceae bacterium KM106-2]
MKSKTIDIILVIFIFVYLFTYITTRKGMFDDVSSLFDQTEKYIQEEKWEEAEESSEQIKEKWNDQLFILMMNYGEGDITTIEEYFRQLISGVKTKDDTTALSSLLIVKDIWKNTTNIVPKP